MTKDEFTSKMRKLSYCDDLSRLALFSEYVESLEAENERLCVRISELEKAIENHLNASKIAFEALQSWDANIAKNYAVILLLNQSPEPPRDKE